MSSREWWLDHPFKVIFGILSGTVLGGFAGVGIDVIGDRRFISPDNVAVGALLGMGGVLAGTLIALFIVCQVNRWHERQG